ncbi:heat shock protein HslJ [Pragia fontium]|uniref:heat shock protein HslJ n=1 Tax=Pragia fontium TaxID=82985 RepID=UPI000F6C5C8F|nr:heat shock protein HslJ [Pragia fontium]VEJ55286.1 Heat shock protein hslJ [Pragia fontium]
MRFALPFIISAALIAGCTSTDNHAVKESDLLHHNFILTSVDGSTIADSGKQRRPLNIEFGENMHISGAMCNNFMGKGTLENGVLTAKQLASTRMACFDEQISKLDQVIADMLAKGANVNLDNRTLTLTTPEHVLTYTLRDRVN